VRRIFAIALIGAAVFATPGESQTPPTSPEDVAKAFFSAVAAKRWSEAAGYLDLEAFEANRKSLIDGYRKPQPVFKWTADSLIKHQPDMPRVAAEYQIEQMKKARSAMPEWIMFEYADVKSVDELASLSAVDAAARMIEAADIRYKYRVAAERSNCKTPAALTTPKFRILPNRILGTIANDSVGYVLHLPNQNPFGEEADVHSHRVRLPASRGDWALVPPSVMILRLVGGRWVIEGGPGMLSQGNDVIMEC
jgi:hypothetical protein